MTAEQPTFTVIIPTFNRSGKIRHAVDSVLAQAYPDFELIVVDDGSTDDTREVIAAVSDRRLRYERQANRGRCAARNAGAESACGEHVTFLDSDDEALPNWLADLAAGFDTDRNVGIVCTGHERILDGGARQTVLPSRLDEFFGASGRAGLFVAGTFAVRREIILEVGGYEERLTFSENTELAIRMVPHCLARGYRLECIERAGTIYHMNRSVSPSRDALANDLASSEYILQTHRDRLALSPRPYSYYLGTAGVRAARLGDYVKARRFFAQAVRQRPTRPRHFGRWLLAAFPPLGRRVWAAPGN